MDYTALCPCLLITFLAAISANVTSTSSLCISCIKYFRIPSDAGELGVVCFPSKLHIKALNPFSCITPSWTCVFVFTPLRLHIYWFYFTFILVFFYLLWLLHVFIFNHFFCTAIFDCGILLVSLVLIFDSVVTWVIYPVWRVPIFMS